MSRTMAIASAFGHRVELDEEGDATVWAELDK
jgi:hypothetical protein